LALTEHGQVRLTLKTPYRDGTTHVIFEPEDFIARLAALVPKPSAHLTRYHGVFAPASALRAQVVPSGRGLRRSVLEGIDETIRIANDTIYGLSQPKVPEPTGIERHRAMNWAARLRRVFAIEIATCRRCGGKLRIIASIDEPEVIERILGHLGADDTGVKPSHPSRAPPPGERLH
jgi:hypothetical protein